MRFSCLLYNALSLLCALLLCMVSYASDFPRDSVEPTVKEWNAVEEFFTWRKTGSARREIPAAVKIIRGKRQ